MNREYTPSLKIMLPQRGEHPHKKKKEGKKDEKNKKVRRKQRVYIEEGENSVAYLSLSRTVVAIRSG